MAPALAEPNGEPVPPAAQASLPEVPVPDLLDPDAEPQLSGGNVQPAPAVETTAETQPIHATGDLSSMVAQLRAADAGNSELNCLATGIYFESKSEPLSGQLAVGHVIANRAKSGGRFPSSYCGVLFQRGQFSFVHGGRLPAVPHSSRQWQTAVAVAKIVDQRLQSSPVANALFFHAKYVSPGWHMRRVAAIGNHIFYR